ncbi:MAG: ABC transporter permease [Planctomycetes bacterium]|nr:ABC transporter permease [Planctomycetota bacterium]
MWFITLVLKNLWRRKVRSILTCTSMAIAVCAVVAMLGTAEGYERSFTDLYEARGVDLVIVRAGITQRIASNLSESLAPRFREVAGVRAVEPTLIDLVTFEKAQLTAVYIFGLRPNGLILEDGKMLEGRQLTPNDHRKVTMGIMLARNLGKKLGDEVEIEGENFEIVGIFDSYNMLESNGAVVPLKELQALMGRHGQVTTFLIFLEPSPNKVESVERIRQQIEDLRDERGQSLRLSVQPTKDHVKSTFETQLLKGLAWASSTIALIIGLVSMLNTMMMSISERLREIATLRAIGWRKSRVIRMIVLESLVLSIIGSFLGVLFAIPLIHFLGNYNVTSNVVDKTIELKGLLKGMSLGIVAGSLGSLYPAWIASRYSPAQALRHE